MTLYLGADHRGYQLKEILEVFLKGEGYEVVDVGAPAYDKDDDYPFIAKEVGKKVSLSPTQSRGIVLCGSGAGVDIVLNKFKRVRCVLGISPDQVFAARNDDDVNALVIAADFIDEENAKNMVTVFLNTQFSNTERAVRRLKEIAEIENSSA